MNSTTKLIIAAVVGVAAFFGYKAIKNGLDEKKDEEQEEKKEASEAEKRAEETKKSEQQKTPVTPKESKKPSTGEPTAYQKRVMVLQELLKVKVDGDAGKQTNGNLDYWWSSDTSFQFNAENSFKSGYANLTKNGKGKVNPENVEYYIKAMQDRISPRHKASGRKSEYVPKLTNPTEKLSRELLAKLGGRTRLKLTKEYTAKELVQTDASTFVATQKTRTWSKGTSFFKGDFYGVRAGTGNLMYRRYDDGNVFYYEIPPQNFEFLRY